MWLTLSIVSRASRKCSDAPLMPLPTIQYPYESTQRTSSALVSLLTAHCPSGGVWYKSWAAPSCQGPLPYGAGFVFLASFWVCPSGVFLGLSSARGRPVSVLCCLQVEPFLLAPLGANLRERDRRKDLLRQRNTHLQLGLQTHQLDEPLQLHNIRSDTASPVIGTVNLLKYFPS